MEFVIGETSSMALANHMQALFNGMCVAGELDIQCAHSTPIDDTVRRFVFTGTDVEEFMEMIQNYHNGDTPEESSYLQESYDLVLCSATYADGVNLQADGTVEVIYDIAECPDLEVWRDCTEDDVVNTFADMIKEIGFIGHGIETPIHSLQEAMEADEIAVREWFSNWVDGRISDGDLPEHAANYSC